VKAKGKQWKHDPHAVSCRGSSHGAVTKSLENRTAAALVSLAFSWTRWKL
ncbi:hypothetical protein TNCT_481071, partial [Trichonephila clavata]